MKYTMVIEINKIKTISAHSYEDAEMKAHEIAVRMGGEVIDVYCNDEQQAIQHVLLQASSE